METPEEHARRIESIRESIENGTYEVDPHDVARSIIDRGGL